MSWSRGYAALALLVTLALGLLPTAVQPCGHHVVHGDIRSLVALHTAHQSAHPASGAWRPALEVGGTSASDEHGDQEAGILHDHHHEHDHDHDRDRDCDHSGDQQLPEQASRGNQSRNEAVSEVRRRRMLQLSDPAPAPLRLSVTYQQLQALDASQQQMLTRVVEAVRRILRKFIMVKRPPSGGLLVDPYCVSYSSIAGCRAYYPNFLYQGAAKRMCGTAAILPDHIVNPANCSRRATQQELEEWGSAPSGPASGAGGGSSAYGSGCSSYAGTQGDATDMYLYITAVQNDDCNAGAAAWALPCLMDLGDNRPLLGAANICPAALRLLDEDSLTAVLAHEMIHALGFTDSMFNLTRRPDGSPRPLGEVLQSAIVDGRNVTRLVTPAVSGAAQAHFGCPSLTGGQLEEEGSEGSAGSHWEYTHFQGEVMVASTIFAADGTPPALSSMTLSYLDDTGWYVTNRSAAGLLTWAAGTGCSLPSSSCRQYMASVPGQRLFCDPSTATSSDGSPSFRCSSSYMATGVCRSLNFTGGCGLTLSRNAEQTCLGPDAANDMPDVFGWGTGSSSGRCLPVVYRFQASMGNGRYTFPSTGRNGDADAACFDTACSADGKVVYVKLLGRQFECPAGQYLDLSRLLPDRYSSGRIGPCPSAEALCSTQSCSASACNPQGGECLNGTCYCRLAYTGPNCSTSLITGQSLPNVDGDGSTGGGSSGPRSPPPPPRSTWKQVVQITQSLFNPPSDVASRQDALTQVLAAWAEVPISQVKIASIAAATGGSAAAGDGSAAGDSYDATAANGRRRALHERGLQQAGGAGGGAPPSPPPPAAASVVTALVTAGGSRATTILVARLRDSTQQSQLAAALASETFFVQPGSLQVQTVITMVVDNPSARGAVVDPSARGAKSTDEGDSSNGKTVIIIAIAAGGAALLGIVVAVVAVVVVRAKRARRNQTKRSNQYQYQLPLTPGVNGAAPAGATAAFLAAQPSAAGLGPDGELLPAQGYPAPGAGAWPTAGYSSGPENAAYSYYSARAAAMSQPAAGQPQPAGVPAALYSGPQYGAYR